MKRISHISLGTIGEDLAVDYLRKTGFSIYGRNWRCRQGEIDIVAWEGNTLVVVEVKTRISSLSARRHLFDTIDFRKQKRLRLLTEIFLSRAFNRVPKHRIDLIGILLSPSSLSEETKPEATEIRHLKAAV